MDLFFIPFLFFAAYVGYKNHNPHARTMIGALLGLWLFTVSPYIHFYSETSASSSVLKYSLLFIPLLLIVVIGFTRFATKAIFVHSSISVILFIAGYLVSAEFDRELKSAISLHTGYFDGQPPFRPTRQFDQNAGVHHDATPGITLSIPDEWRENHMESTNSLYFTFSQDDKILAEIRVTCMHSQELTLPEIVFNHSGAEYNRLAESAVCYKQGDFRACLLKEKKSQDWEKRWRWIAASQLREQFVALDMVQYVEEPYFGQVFEYVMSSMKLIPPSSEACPPISMKWL
ncbi:hypothetical protein EUZ85_26425 [Hahella sp. KA22]|uniref:hypothetical protein n=1 Tax=Hahella sp. KA22 TaxID=1628392 RepID=UPI000FDD42CE|nr:hypothetical protein [Hahella sp. KA22]AZZ94062.1 hypothetical protein ENC22_23840 [Hahella sp. KA22]QAY57436.1 hypothetical protein EUZ85_26425 [Hahella sp. KA22]